MGSDGKKYPGSARAIPIKARRTTPTAFLTQIISNYSILDVKEERIPPMGRLLNEVATDWQDSFYIILWLLWVEELSSIMQVRRWANSRLLKMWGCEGGSRNIS